MDILFLYYDKIRYFDTFKKSKMFICESKFFLEKNIF